MTQIMVWVALRPTQNGRHLQAIFWNLFSSMKMFEFTQFVTRCPTDNTPALVQIMAWGRTGDKLPSEPMVVKFIYASFGLNELWGVGWTRCLGRIGCPIHALWHDVDATFKLSSNTYSLPSYDVSETRGVRLVLSNRSEMCGCHPDPSKAM